jgi:hypothetical protein
MPLYPYQHPVTEEIIEVFQKMTDTHEYFDESGLKWNRVFTIPYASQNSILKDAYSAKDFNRLTEKGGTFGMMYDLSKELSEKRAEKEGLDPVSEARDAKTAAEGLPVFTDPKVKLKKANEKLKKWGVTLTEKKPATRSKK